MAYYVNLLSSKKHGTLYLGVTNDIIRRVHEHRTNAAKGFTSRYGVHNLVWFEIYDDVITAIAREKELKKCARSTPKARIASCAAAPMSMPGASSCRDGRTAPRDTAGTFSKRHGEGDGGDDVGAQVDEIGEAPWHR